MGWLRSWFPDHVYAILGSHGMVKIGYSWNPEKRVRELQTGSPFQLTLAFAIDTHGYGPDVEAEAHQMLDKHRQSGEWFAVPVDVAVAAISAARFRIIKSVEERPTRWWLRYAVLTALLAPVWTFATPVPFLCVAFALIAWSSFRLLRHRGAIDRPGALRWLGAIIGATVTSMAIAMPFMPARADEATALPDYDRTNYCDNISAFMKKNQAVLDGCRSNETTAKQNLQRVWSETPEDVRKSCVSMVELGTVGTYQGLSGCVSLGVGKLWMDGKLEIRSKG